ncbi:MAG: DNA-binding protein [Pseudomonadota bacterium]
MENTLEIKLPEELRVISEKEAADYCSLSLVHFRRLRHHRKGPRYVQLTERRFGYRFKDLADWIEQRVC